MGNLFNQRIREYIKVRKISMRKFEESCNFSNGYINNLNAFPSADKLEYILSVYPDLSRNWLLTGQPPMLKSNELTKIHNSKSIERNYEEQDIPLYDIDAAANLSTMFQNKEQNILDSLRIPNLSKVDGAVYVKGDSMYPLLKSGDIVIYKEIYDLTTDLFMGEMYLISMEVAGDEYVVVKYVNKSDIEGCVKLVSYNTHHEPKDVPITTIKAMAIVKASLRFNL